MSVMFPKNYTVLLLDFNAKYLKYIKKYLDQGIYLLINAKSIEDAFNHIDLTPPDLVIIAVDENIDNTASLYIDLKNYAHGNLPILFIGDRNTNTLNKLYKYNDIDFIQEPINRLEFQGKVANSIKNYRFKHTLEEYNVILQKKCKRFEEINEYIADLVWETDSQGNLKYISNNLTDILGYRPKELIGKPPAYTLVDFEDGEYPNILGLKEPIKDLEKWHYHKNGNKVCLNTSIIPIYDKKMNITSYRGFNNDITDRKKAENKIISLNQELEQRVLQRTKELKAEKDFTDHIINSLPGIFYAFNSDGEIERTNKNFMNIKGFSEDEIKSYNISHAMEDDPDITSKALKDLREKGSTFFEKDILLKDGTTRPYFLTGSNVTINNNDYIVGFGVDISDQKNVEFEVTRLSQAVSQSPIAIVITEVDSTINYANEAFLDVSGYSESEILGSKTSILKSGLHSSEFYKELWNTILSGQTWKGELLNRKKSGEIYCEFTTISPIFNDTGDIVSFVAVKDDITKRKQREKELRDKTLRYETHNSYLSQLTQSEGLTEKTLAESYDTITKFSLLGLNISKSSLWLFNADKTELSCISQFSKKESSNYVGSTISATDFPVYFRSIKFNKPIITSDASKDLRTIELYQKFHNKQKTVALLDIPIWVRGEIFGVICNENHSDKVWKNDEVSYARSLSYFVSLVVEANDRQIAQSKAEDATKAKSDFIANMSHEIRTPMNAIVGLLHLISRTDLNSKQQNYINKINMASNNLLAIINDILDFSKIESGKIDIEKEDFNLSEVFENVYNILHAKADSKGIKYSTVVDKNVPMDLNGDSLRIGQVLMNLVSNAIKFTEEGFVKVHCSLIDKFNDNIWLKFRVEDTGIGLTKEQIDKMFKSFSQADTSTTRKYGGTGLGLSISKKIVELMSGTIEVESEYQKGSTFTFSVKVKKSKEFESDNMTIPDSFENSKVLIISKDEDTVEYIDKYLSKYKFSITNVNNTFKGIEEIGESNRVNTPYNFIFIDLILPKINGLETIKRVKNLISGYQTKTILMCDYSREDILKEARQSGYDSILLKPINSKNLDNIFLTLLEDEFIHIKKEKDNNLKNSEVVVTNGKRVLLAEDNEINQQVIVEILDQENLTIDVANDGVEAVELATKNLYDLILMDIQMPKLDGLEATKKIREIYSSDILPIIALTGNATTKVEKSVLDGGMNDFVSKPINIKKLFETINRWISINSSVTEKAKSVEIIQGINFEDGLARTNGKLELYRKLLYKFYTNYSDAYQRINNDYNKGEYKACSTLVHTLKGVAGNISAIGLYNICVELENAYETEDHSNCIELLEKLKNESEKVMNSLNSYFNKNPIVNSISKTSNNNFNFEKEIKNLHDKLTGHKIESRIITENLISQIDNNELKLKLTEILKNIENFDFEKSLQIVKSLRWKK